MILVTGLFIIVACNSSVDSEEQSTEQPSALTTTVDEAIYAVELQPFSHFEEAVMPIVDELQQPRGLLNGQLQNDKGDFCWYTQLATTEDSRSYFYETLTGSDTLMVFDKGCMTAATPIGMSFFQRTVNEIIGRWYSKPDAAFQTKPIDLYPSSQFQENGWCMQSATYPTQAVAIEYFGDADVLAAVVHNITIGGCTQ